MPEWARTVFVKKLGWLVNRRLVIPPPGKRGLKNKRSVRFNRQVDILGSQDSSQSKEHVALNTLRANRRRKSSGLRHMRRHSADMTDVLRNAHHESTNSFPDSIDNAPSIDSFPSPPSTSMFSNQHANQHLLPSTLDWSDNSTSTSNRTSTVSDSFLLSNLSDKPLQNELDRDVNSIVEHIDVREVKKTNLLEWQFMSAVIDRILFYVFLISVVVSMVVMLCRPTPDASKYIAMDGS